MNNEAPVTRGDCKEIQRPCPFIRCRYHMLWVAMEKGCRYNHRYRFMMGDILAKYTDDQILDIMSSLPRSCVLDVADEGFHTLHEIASILGLCHQRIQAIAKGIGPVRGYLEKMRDALEEDAPYRKAVNSVGL